MVNENMTGGINENMTGGYEYRDDSYTLLKDKKEKKSKEMKRRDKPSLQKYTLSLYPFLDFRHQLMPSVGNERDLVITEFSFPLTH